MMIPKYLEPKVLDQDAFWPNWSAGSIPPALIPSDPLSMVTLDN